MSAPLPASQRAATRAVRRVLKCGPSRAGTLAHAVLAEVASSGCTVLEPGEGADPLLSNEEVAQRYGMKASTWRAYVARGTAPQPDTYVYGRVPAWRSSTLDGWRPAP